MKAFIFLLLLAGLTARAENDAELVARYLQYKTLPRITAEKVDIADSVKFLCLDPRMQYGPHIKPGIHIYASPSAMAAKQRDPGALRYPIGTLFVKEKFETKEDTDPNIITVMEKIANTGKVEDWQFTMIRLSDRSIVRDGFRISCVKCHSYFTLSDFVSRQTDLLLSAFVQKQESNRAPDPIPPARD